jgi:hypothetical protein
MWIRPDCSTDGLTGKPGRHRKRFSPNELGVPHHGGLGVLGQVGLTAAEPDASVPPTAAAASRMKFDRGRSGPAIATWVDKNTCIRMFNGLNYSALYFKR